MRMCGWRSRLTVVLYLCRICLKRQQLTLNSIGGQWFAGSKCHKRKHSSMLDCLRCKRSLAHAPVTLGVTGDGGDDGKATFH
eukprot:6212856-Pleurochrysis_carterae.AAC.6